MKYVDKTALLSRDDVVFSADDVAYIESLGGSLLGYHDPKGQSRAMADAEGAFPSLVTTNMWYRTQEGLPTAMEIAESIFIVEDKPPTRKQAQCPKGMVLQVETADGAWRWVWKACGSWVCEPCRFYRIKHELVPELIEALLWCRDIGEVLKLLTLTWKGMDEGAQPTSKGAKRRKLDTQHLAQYMRRDKGVLFEYMRVAESHKTGKIHHHLPAIMPYMKQSELSDEWKNLARGSFRVHIEAAYMRCPNCWPGPKASPEQKRRSRIIPPPGSGQCLNCGLRPNWDEPAAWRAVATQMAWEIAKYLTKEADLAGVKKKLTRSKGWAARCQVKKDKGTPEVVYKVTPGEMLYGRVREGSVLSAFSTRLVKSADGQSLQPLYTRLKKYPLYVLAPVAQRIKITYKTVWKRPDCECCEGQHSWRWVGKEGSMGDAEEQIMWAIKEHIAYFPHGKNPCRCFGDDVKWYEGGAIPADRPAGASEWDAGKAAALKAYIEAASMDAEPSLVCDASLEATPGNGSVGNPKTESIQPSRQGTLL